VLKLPPLAVITEMSVQPDPKTQLQVNFELVDKVPQDLLPALLAKRKDALPLLNAGYDAPAEAPAGGKKY
jgi:hypothetical protein